MTWTAAPHSSAESSARRTVRCFRQFIITSQADQARTDFAGIESELEVIQKQLARLPTRRELAGPRSVSYRRR